MKKVLFIFLFITIIQSGCEKSGFDDTDGLHHWDILKVEGPVSGATDVIIKLSVTCPTSSGCDVVKEFITERHGSEFLIKALGFTRDGFCTQAAIPVVKEYTFSSDDKGDFIMKFIKTDSSTIDHYITIN